MLISLHVLPISRHGVNTPRHGVKLVPFEFTIKLPKPRWVVPSQAK